MRNKFLVRLLTVITSLSIVANIGILDVKAAENSKVYNYSSGVQTYTVETSGNYKIDAYGASGGNYNYNKGGLGGQVKSTYELKKGDIIEIYTGGIDGTNGLGGNYSGKSGGEGASGGGATVVRLVRNGSASVLEVAGGGGGANKHYNGKNGGIYTHASNSAYTDGGGGGGYNNSGNGLNAVIDNPFIVWNPVKNPDGTFKYPDPVYTYQPDSMNENNYIINKSRSDDNGVGFTSISGHTEQKLGLYGYAQTSRNGVILLNSGAFDVSDSTSIIYEARFDCAAHDINWDGTDKKPNEYSVNLDESYIELVDQNNNSLEKFTARDIINGKEGSTTGIHWNYPPIPPEEAQKISGMCYWIRYYNVSKKYDLPDGVTNVRIFIRLAYNNNNVEFGTNSGVSVNGFYGSKGGVEASGGNNYINTAYSATDTDSQSGINSGNGKVIITNLHTHKYTDKVITEPKCTTKGVKRFTCECGDYYDVEIDALGHITPTSWTLKTSSTCTTKGTEVKHCQREGCGVLLDSRDVAALGHLVPDNWTRVTNPTCTEKGLERKNCQRSGCGVLLESRAVDALGHIEPSEWHIVTEPKCTTKGLKDKHCLRENCGVLLKEEAIEALGHLEPTKWNIVTEPKCTTTGLKNKHCERDNCNVLLKEEIIAALGHLVPDSWTKIKEPNCTKPGLQKKYCQRNNCGVEVDSEVIAALGHIEPGKNEWIYKDNNNITNGTRYRQCKRTPCTYIFEQTWLNIVRYRLENVDGSFTNYSNTVNNYYKDNVLIQWNPYNILSNEDKNLYNVIGQVKFYTEKKAQIKDITIYRKRIALDIDGQYINKLYETTSGLCTFDIYINGVLAGNDITEYKNNTLIYGTTFYINDIKINKDREYTGNDVTTF